jgi:hypothetical protein
MFTRLPEQTAVWRSERGFSEDRIERGILGSRLDIVLAPVDRKKETELERTR